MVRKLVCGDGRGCFDFRSVIVLFVGVLIVWCVVGNVLFIFGGFWDFMGVFCLFCVRWLSCVIGYLWEWDFNVVFVEYLFDEFIVGVFDGLLIFGGCFDLGLDIDGICIKVGYIVYFEVIENFGVEVGFLKVLECFLYCFFGVGDVGIVGYVNEGDMIGKFMYEVGYYVD